MSRCKHIFSKATGNPKCLNCGLSRRQVMKKQQINRQYMNEYTAMYGKKFNIHG